MKPTKYDFEIEHVHYTDWNWSFSSCRILHLNYSLLIACLVGQQFFWEVNEIMNHHFKKSSIIHKTVLSFDSFSWNLDSYSFCKVTLRSWWIGLSVFHLSAAFFANPVFISGTKCILGNSKFGFVDRILLLFYSVKKRRKFTCVLECVQCTFCHAMAGVWCHDSSWYFLWLYFAS